MAFKAGVVSKLRKYATALAALVGLVLAIIGAAVGVTGFWGVLCLGTGSSMIAAALYTTLAEFREEFAERL